MNKKVTWEIIPDHLLKFTIPSKEELRKRKAVLEHKFDKAHGAIYDVLTN